MTHYIEVSLYRRTVGPLENSYRKRALIINNALSLLNIFYALSRLSAIVASVYVGLLSFVDSFVAHSDQKPHFVITFDCQLIQKVC